MTKRMSRGLGGLTILFVLALWQAGPTLGVVDRRLIPPASAVLERFVTEWFEHSFYIDLGATSFRVLLGLLIAVAIGVPTGIAMGYSLRVNRMLALTVDAVRPIPATAFVPVGLILFGIGSGMHIFVVCIAAIVPILLSSLDGTRAVDPVLIGTADTLGCRGARAAWSVLLPAALPQIVTGIRVGIAQALIVDVSSEMVLSSDGLGHRVLYAQRILDIAGLYAGVLTLAAVGYGLNRLFVAIESLIVGWNRRAREKVWN
jgi:ABC-type nitrate/sulfonate/bicarbonate transport system permease component